MLELVNVTAGYGGNRVLSEVNLRAESNKITTIVGASGSGKSTILRILMGFVRPLSGQVIVDGEDITRLRESAMARVREKMGLVFQESALFDSLTVEQNVGFYLLYGRRRKWRDVAPLVRDILNELGLSGYEKKFPSELSGGMIRRVALARALIYRPKILLYDEPTTGLDPAMVSVVNDMIIEMSEKFKVTSVVVTHDLDTVLTVSDDTYLLSGGTAIHVGSPINLLLSDNEEIRKFTASWSEHIKKFAEIQEKNPPKLS